MKIDLYSDIVLLLYRVEKVRGEGIREDWCGRKTIITLYGPKGVGITKYEPQQRRTWVEEGL